MRHFDLTPLYRSTVGFDRLVQLMDNFATGDLDAPYPPYNIERLSENEYRITMAVAGFRQDELRIDVRESTLAIRGEKKAESADTDKRYHHRGIASRSFERRFQLADYVEVKSASLTDGLLNIDLVRNLPERMKPRTVTISAGAEPEAKQIETAA